MCATQVLDVKQRLFLREINIFRWEIKYPTGQYIVSSRTLGQTLHNFRFQG